MGPDQDPVSCSRYSSTDDMVFRDINWLQGVVAGQGGAELDKETQSYFWVA